MVVRRVARVEPVVVCRVRRVAGGVPVVAAAPSPQSTMIVVDELPVVFCEYVPKGSMYVVGAEHVRDGCPTGDLPPCGVCPRRDRTGADDPT